MNKSGNSVKIVHAGITGVGLAWATEDITEENKINNPSQEHCTASSSVRLRRNQSKAQTSQAL